MKIKVTTAFNDLQNGCITCRANEVLEKKSNGAHILRLCQEG
ncbi:hypothetical protein ACTQ3L_03970 [Oscillospiraceae bacterium LCP25S3_E4]